MNIFIDESGSFVNASKSGAWNSIAAYMSPEPDRRRLREIVMGFKLSVGAPPHAEVKLRSADEANYFAFLEQLAQLDGVLYVVATDAGLNHSSDISEHQKSQAAKIIEHKEKMLFQSARDGLQDLSERIAALAPQLYVQLHCQINLLATVIRSGVLYFVQRHPKCLSHFRWRIDQKNSIQTNYEKAFVSVAPAFLQSISLRDPMPMLIGADYSAFSRFDYAPEQRPTYLRDAYGIEINEEELATNIGMLINDNLQFVNSENNVGIQTADLLASGIRRCLRNSFKNNELAADLLGQLMVQNQKGRPPIKFLGFSKSETFVDGPIAHLTNIMVARSRRMLI